MEKIFALVNDGVVENRIVAETEFILQISSQWQFVVRVDELEQQPDIGWTYDGSNFAPPSEE